jgi:hypothetical protein
LACEEDEIIISVASEEVDLTVILLLPLVVFRAGVLDAGLLLPRLPLHHAKARGERGGRYPGTIVQAMHRRLHHDP